MVPAMTVMDETATALPSCSSSRLASRLKTPPLVDNESKERISEGTNPSMQ